MSAISLKSITGITSITTPTGVDNQLTLHTNDTTQRVKVTQSGIEVVGVATFQDIDVDGHTNLDNVSIAGVVTATSFATDGGHMYITNAMPALYLTDTNNNPDWRIQNVNGTLSFIDATNNVHRIEINTVGNVSLSNDLDVDGHTNLDNVNVGGATTTTGVVVISAGTQSTNTTSGALRVAGGVGVVKNVNVGGDLDVDGHTNLDNLSVAGVVTATSFVGSGANLTSLPVQATITNNANNRVITGGSGVNLNGEVNLYFDGSKLVNSGSQTLTSGTAPQYRLNASSADGSDNDRAILGLATASNHFINGTSAGDTILRTTNSGNLLFGVGTSEKLRITSEGQVKLTGNNSGNHMSSFGTNVGGLTIDDVGNQHTGLEVSHGSNKVFLVASSNNSVYMSSYGTGNFLLEHTGSGGTRERLRITSTGKLGVGNNNPSFLLDLKATSSADVLRLGNTAESTHGNADVKIVAGGSYYQNFDFQASTYKFQTYNGSSLGERLRIASTGQVSISSDGTTDGLLTIKGNSDQVGTPSIRLLDGSDTREVSISNTAGDFVVSVHGNDNAIHGHIKMFESGIIDFNNGGATGSNVNRLRISTKGQLLLGNTSEDQGLAVFWNAPGSGADAGTAGADGGGDKGVNIRTDMGPTHLDLTGVDNYTLKLANQAYAGAGVADPNGTVSKILFNTVTYNGWNSYGAIALQSQGASSSRGEMVFMLNNGTSSMNEKLRIKANQMNTANGLGMNIYGENINHSDDAVLLVDKTGNSDWCIQARSTGNDYGMYARLGSGAAYALAVYATDTSSFRFRVRGDGVIFASNTTIQSISDVRLKENIVDANSQWDDIKGLRFRNFNWKSDSGYDDGKTMLGLIAQEVEPISPNLVDLDAQTKEDIENGVPDPEYKSVKYSIVWMKAVKALQEAQARIEQLEAKVAALESS